MTHYILHISSYGGLVPGAQHYRGRVEGPRPKSCHGQEHHGATKSGQVECDEGHVLPGQVSWEVEAAWTEAQYERWAAKSFEGDGPTAFYTSREVMDRAMVQFLDGSGGDDRWWEQRVEPAAEGDELWYGWIAREGGQDDEYVDDSDGWGTLVARKNTG